ncbi:MAG TPA: glycerophosphodiester phosphodiesterase family protein [Caldilineaceae bacterium]|nr:glycerophosphodiester phosphodiesterase family protein [Caldilineaceae bacterium]
MRSIEIVCHRGANEYAPENTYASAQRCVEWGVDYLEIDINRSQDGVFYLFHGPELERTTNGRGAFPTTTAAVIDQLDAGSWFAPVYANQRVPRLEPFLGWIKGKCKLFLDIKAGTPAEIVQLIRTFALEQECFVWSGSNDWAYAFRRLAPDLQLKLNVRSVAEVVAAHERFHANIVEVGPAEISQPMLDTARQLGIKTMLYIQGKDPIAYRQAITWGVEMINLNYADLFLQVWEETTRQDDTMTR